MRSTTSRMAWLLAPVLVTISVVGLAGPATGGQGRGETGPPDASVANWDAVGTQAFTAAALSPAEGHTIFAYVAIAVYDSVMAVEGGYKPFLVDADAPDGASAEAAVAAAARGVLDHYLPDQSASIVEPAYTAALAAIPDGTAESDGVAIGAEVARELIALRADDGFRAPVTYTPPDPPVPGAWLPTAPTPPVGPYLGLMTPFALASADQFRPAGPPDLRGRRWARDYNEVKEIGSSTSTTRTADQTLAARFWAEPPVQQARGSFRNFVLDHELDVVGAARFMAMISVTYADALIACFDAKYHFAFWRPITAIRAGDTDGNARTAGDPSWSTLLPATPNHPEYPSAHSCITPAAGWVIARFLPALRIDFTIPSVTGLGDRTFARPGDLTYEVSNARIWGGIHFRSAVDDGVGISMRVTFWVLAHHFHQSHR
ncbi:vanadium-dependent haloperoxidase [Microbacterium sp. zg.B185]|nr:vanadium-dependent haloperoxidase [Microbacterium sp. zg.B185]MCR2809929.1 vanadium-dependent haloperoxidase [Microbacterium sp. zg.B185]